MTTRGQRIYAALRVVAAICALTTIPASCAGKFGTISGGATVEELCAQWQSTLRAWDLHADAPEEIEDLFIETEVWADPQVCG